MKSNFFWLAALLVSLHVLLPGQSIAAQGTPEARSYQQGLALFASGNYKEAIESFKETIALNPNNADAFNQPGTSYRMVERFPEAIDAPVMDARDMGKQ